MKGGGNYEEGQEVWRGYWLWQKHEGEIPSSTPKHRLDLNTYIISIDLENGYSSPHPDKRVTNQA